jgi:hypothetical protein
MKISSAVQAAVQTLRGEAVPCIIGIILRGCFGFRRTLYAYFRRDRPSLHSKTDVACGLAGG